MRGLLVAFRGHFRDHRARAIQLVVTFIAQLMSISWGALAGAFLGPFPRGLYSKKAHLEGRRVDKLHRRRRPDQRKHDCRLLRPRAYRKPHQLRRARNAALARDCAAREPGYQAGRFRHGHRAAEPQERDRPRNRSRSARGGPGGNRSRLRKRRAETPIQRTMDSRCLQHARNREASAKPYNARRVSRTQGIP